MMTIQFSDKVVSYDTFLNDLSARLCHLLKDEKDDPEYISQRKAYKLFGRANVDRWLKAGKVTPHKRPGKVEYNMSELRVLQHTQQDYL